MKALLQLALFLGIGLAIAWVFKVDVRAFAHTTGYEWIAYTLLAIGLYSGTYAIEPRSIKQDGKLIGTAVTLGVIVKALLIGGILSLAWHDPLFLLLGVAVAQIDPLAVAALMGDNRMSQRARSILAAWSSFDDPITVLLTIYLATFISLTGPSPLGWFTSLAGNLALAAIIIVLTRFLQSRFHTNPSHPAPPAPNPAAPLASGQATPPALDPAVPTVPGPAVREAEEAGPQGEAPRSKVVSVLTYVVLAAGAVVAVAMHWMLAVAIVGFLLKPAALGRWLPRVTAVALAGASILLGMVLSNGVQLGRGVTLGLAAFGSQIVVALLLARKLPKRDRVHLELAQQNGITAIILALALEIQVAGAAAIIAPAILVVNLTHLVANRLYDRRVLVRN